MTEQVDIIGLSMPGCSMTCTRGQFEMDRALIPPAVPVVSSLASSPNPIAQHACQHRAGGLLLDVFAGAHAPISAVADRAGLARFFDLDANAEHDILDDAWCELLLRTCWSGILSLLTLAPPCKQYSRLKLRPGGPKALRTPRACQICRLISDQKLVAESKEVHRRGRELFKAVPRNAAWRC